MPDALIIEGFEGGDVGVSYWRSGQAFPEPSGSPFPFEAPFGDRDLADLRWYLEEYLASPFGLYEDRGPTIEARLEDWGHALFALFFGPGAPGRDVYQRAREREAELVVRGSDPGFLALPWELMRDPDRPTPLALDTGLRGLSRSQSSPGGSCAPSEGPELRVLMVISRPRGLADVDFQMVARPLHDCLRAVRGKVIFDVARPPTLEALEARLRAAAEAGHAYHALHFDGHGVYAGGGVAGNGERFDARGPGGLLLFEDGRGGDHRVSAEDFAQAIKRGRVPLVILNACQSAMVGPGAETANATVATRLMAEGVGAVVAMSHSVYAVAAAEFMSAFYDALFRGRSVVEAMTAGRLRLKRRPDRPTPKGPMPLADWMVPVLYSRAELSFPQLARTPDQDGISFDLALDAAATGATDAAPQAGVHGLGTIDDAPPEGFVGRGGAFYTLELAARLQRVVVIHGPGGTGKTELAKGFARWWRDTGGTGRPDWVFFHSFEPGVASFGLDGVVSAIGLHLFGSDFLGQTRDAAHRREVVLETLRKHAMLLVWDNFETVASMPDPNGITAPLDATGQAEVRAFLQALSAPGGQTTVLITSRTEEAWLGDMRRLPLSGLPSLEAAEYADRLLSPYPTARTRWRDPGERAANAALMEWLAGHPLSLRLMLRHLETRSASELLAGLKGQGPLPEGFLGEGRTEGLGASVRYSLDHLPEARRRLLPVLSLFEGAVDVDVLAVFSAVDQGPEPFAGIDRAGWQATLDAAAGFGLLRALGAGVYELHPALPGYLAAEWRAGVSADDHAATREIVLDALAEAHSVFGRWLLQQIKGGDAGTAFGLLGLQRRTFGAMILHQIERARHGSAQDMLQPLADFLEARGLTAELRRWLDRCLAALDTDRPALGSESGALWLYAKGFEANLALKAHDLDAAAATYDDIRRMLEAAAPGEARDRYLATSYGQLGIVAQLRGRLDDAETWYEKSLEINEALGNRPGMAMTYHQLGIVAQRSGRLDDAETWYKKSLEIKEALGNRPGMASSYHQLGMVAQERGRLDDAETWYKKSLEINEALGNRPGMATSYHQLGMVAQERGRLDDAETWYKKSLQINKALGNRPGMVSTYHQLGTLAQERGRLDDAETWYKKSLEIKEALGNRPGMASSYGQLGLLAEACGDPHAALGWMTRCIGLFDTFPHPATGPAPHHLARLYRTLGRDALAAQWREITGTALSEDLVEALDRLGDHGQEKDN